MPKQYLLIHLAVGILAIAIAGCGAGPLDSMSAKPAGPAIIEPEPSPHAGGQIGDAATSKPADMVGQRSQTFQSKDGTITLEAMPAEVNPEELPQPGKKSSQAVGEVASPSSSQPASSPALETSTAETMPAPIDQPAKQKVQTMTVGGKEVVASAVLQVNSQFITIDDILRSASERLSAIPQDIGADAFRKRAVQIITDEVYKQMSEYLVLAEANSRFTDEIKKRIETEVDRVQLEMISKTGGGSKKKLQEVLELQGTTLDAVMGDIRRRITVRAFLHEKIVPSIRINRQMMWDYYKAHPSEFAQPAQVAMQTISIPFRDFLPAGSQAGDAEKQLAIQQARETIAKAQAQLQAGTAFEQVANAYSKDSRASQGGSWPLMSEGSFREVAVEQAAFALKQGQVSDIIQTGSGVYLVKARQVAPGKVTSFEEAQDKIEQALSSQQEHELTDAYFKKLQEGMSVVPYSNFMELAVEKAFEKYYAKK
jgi:parvulin-like peptidyl-prolyl isomerase